jgi:hypothetical protein
VCKRRVGINQHAVVSLFRHTRQLVGATTLGLILSASNVARADASDQVGYSQKQVYSAAVRYLRIDLRYEITERDPDAAYLLFEYQPMGQTSARFGAVEIVKLQQGVRMVIRLPDQPSYREAMLRDGLLKKLHSDYGQLPPPSKEAPPKKGADEGEKSPGARSIPREDVRPDVRP